MLRVYTMTFVIKFSLCKLLVKPSNQLLIFHYPWHCITFIMQHSPFCAVTRDVVNSNIYKSIIRELVLDGCLILWIDASIGGHETREPVVLQIQSRYIVICVYWESEDILRHLCWRTFYINDNNHMFCCVWYDWSENTRFMETNEINFTWCSNIIDTSSIDNLLKVPFGKIVLKL